MTVRNILIIILYIILLSYYIISRSCCGTRIVVIVFLEWVIRSNGRVINVLRGRLTSLFFRSMMFLRLIFTLFSLSCRFTFLFNLFITFFFRIRFNLLLFALFDNTILHLKHLWRFMFNRYVRIFFILILLYLFTLLLENKINWFNSWLIILWLW